LKFVTRLIYFSADPVFALKKEQSHVRAQIATRVLRLPQNQEETMNRRSLISLSAIAALGLAVLPGIAVSQQKSLKDAIIGSWSITSVFDQYENGKKNNPWGAGLKSSLVFDGAGRFSQIIIGEPQPDMKTADTRKPDALIVAYYGSYTVNEGNKTIAIKIDGHSYSPRAGTQQTWTVAAIKGDTLSLVGSPRKDQEGTFSPQLELKRAK
jgi:hypothetical protein